MDNQDNKIQREWHLLDAKNKVLGRLAGEIAILLRGKNKPQFVLYEDRGDWVVVINAGQIRVTGKKAEQKKYYRHSGYPGGLKTEIFKKVFGRDPSFVLRKAVRGMLPDNKLRKPMLRRLKIFADQKHPYQNKLTERQESP
ncbi:MAG: large subunit ribosomal protein L13 [Parcubacteria group bacterium LiPW_72]|nr:MAG: large subunit ribosomal protein L13 [Parcubacteria group bacterium LiPW_72]